MMELHAAGFNAWNQLHFDSQPGKVTADSEPDDISSFTRVLAAGDIRIPVSGLSYTLVETEGGKIVAAGFLEGDASEVSLCHAYHSVTTATGETLQNYDVKFSDITCDTQGAEPQPPSRSQNVQQLAAYDTGFVALLDDGSVWVKGDERFPNCLAVHPDEERTPGSWNRVQWLDELPTGPVVRIAAGGYTLAALTEGGDIYCWGGRPSQQPLFEDLSNMPIPVDVADNDVKDVALGEHHIIVLTVDGHVLVRGSNKSGQLGLGQDGPTWVGEWTRVENVLEDTNWDVERVAAGSKTSFIITRRVGRK